MSADRYLTWVDFGRQAWGIVQRGKLEGVLYWQAAAVAEDDGDPVVLPSGFYLVDTNTPLEHECVAEDAQLEDWDDVSLHAAHTFLDRRGVA